MRDSDRKARGCLRPFLTGSNSPKKRASSDGNFGDDLLEDDLQLTGRAGR